MTIDVAFNSLSAYILVFGRIGGMIMFNPLLSRKNIPSQFRVALVLGITFLITPIVGQALPSNLEGFRLIFSLMKELLVGFACGFVFQTFYYLLFTVGDVVDMGFGLSMAKAFDPGSNVQMSMSGNIFQLIFVIYFFATNSHLAFIKMMVNSYDLVSIGAVTYGRGVAAFAVNLFSDAFLLAMQLALPFMAAAMVMELVMGILMKLVPQVNVFAIHFQLKIIVGFSLLFLFITPVANFLDSYANTMFKSMQMILAIV